MVTPRWVATRTQPIAYVDIRDYLVGCAAREETTGRAYDVGGPEILDYRQMLERTATLMGRRRPLIVSVPVLTPRLSSLWIGLVTPVDRRVARPLVDGLRNETVVRDDAIRRVLPSDLLGFDDAVRRALAGPPLAY
jgi:uncharacterized protein YbjT (DUF2867 family)